MGGFLIVSKVENLEAYQQLSNEYQLAYELNDFFDPSVLGDEVKRQEIISTYKKYGIPEGSTMHGAFFDIVIFSYDEQIRNVSKMRMKQSMEIARELGVKGVIFHTNWNLLLNGEVYNNHAVELICEYVEELLIEYSEIDIYLENMFDDGPDILCRISEQLSRYHNYGVCFDYAHAIISKTDINYWLECLGPYMKHVHINDNDLQNDLHLAIGEGEINWDCFVKNYIKYFSECSVLIETTNPENQKKSLEYLKERFGFFETDKLLKIKGECTMKSNYSLNAEELLEKIFYYMNALLDTRDFDAAVLLLTELGRTLVGSERASFWYWDRKKKQYWTLAALGSDRIIVEEGSGIVGVSISQNETVVINNPYEDPRFNQNVDKETGFVTKSILCMPVTNENGDVIGAYQAINKIDENGDSNFDDQDVKRLVLAAAYCGKTLESHILRSESQIDPLTGLKNRRGFDEYYEKVTKSLLELQPVYDIMCDIDHFKKVNDTYGHNAGDAVLVYVADILKSYVANQGEVIRWGGEEFVILLNDLTGEEAISLAESIRQKVERSICSFGTDDIKVTMSFGVDQMMKESSPEENVKRVDAKLYRAKETGRNRVISD